MTTEFYIVFVEGYEEPMPCVGPYPTYNDAIRAHYQHALDEWPTEEVARLKDDGITPEDFYLTDDAVRIARVDREES